MFGKIVKNLFWEDEGQNSQEISAEKLHSDVLSYIKRGNPALDNARIGRLCSTPAWNAIFIELTQGLDNLLKMDTDYFEDRFRFDLKGSFNGNTYFPRSDHNAVGRFKTMMTICWNHIPINIRRSILQNPEISRWLNLDINAPYEQLSISQIQPGTTQEIHNHYHHTPALPPAAATVYQVLEGEPKTQKPIPTKRSDIIDAVVWSVKDRTVQPASPGTPRLPPPPLPVIRRNGIPLQLSAPAKPTDTSNPKLPGPKKD
jgi:hypothetical protein